MNIIRELRKKAGIQQKELALEIGVSIPTVSEWENGKKDPSGDRLKRLAEYFGVDELVILGVSIDDLLGDQQRQNHGIELSETEYRLVMYYRKADHSICEAAFTMLENSAKKKEMMAG